MQKREDDANKILKVFPEQEDMQILNGRWGAYLKVGKDNVKLPKDSNWEIFTYEECVKLHKEQPAAKKTGRFAKKTTTASATKKAPAKKAPAKKKK